MSLIERHDYDHDHDKYDNPANTLTQALADLAARHIATEGLSYAQAKRKALKQTSMLEHQAVLPSNFLIEKALRAYFSECMPQAQAAELQRLRQLACTWLERLSQLELNLRALAVGAVVNGTAFEHSPVHLQVFTDEFKALEIAFLNQNRAVEPTEQTIDGRVYPVLVLQDKGVPIVLTILPASNYSTPKLPTVAGEFLQASTLIQLRRLMAE